MDHVDKAAELFAVLSHPSRLKVLALLAEQEPRSAGDLQTHTELERTALSHQLRILRDANLVSVERDGRRHLYRLSDHHVAHIVGDAIAHVQEVRS